MRVAGRKSCRTFWSDKQSSLIMTIRKMGYIDACVLILALQTAMFASFGNPQESWHK